MRSPRCSSRATSRRASTISAPSRAPPSARISPPSWKPKPRNGARSCASPAPRPSDRANHKMANQGDAVRILCTLGLRGVMTEIAPMLAGRGLGFAATYGATNMLLGRVAAGGSADVAVLVDAAIEELTRQGTMAAGSRRDLARSGIGIAVAAGAARPGIRPGDGLPDALPGGRP